MLIWLTPHACAARYDNGITGGVISMVSTQRLLLQSLRGLHADIMSCLLSLAARISGAFLSQSRAGQLGGHSGRGECAITLHATRHYLSSLTSLRHDLAQKKLLGHAAEGSSDPYCKFDNQTLQWFTSSLFIAGVFAALPAGYTTRCLTHILRPDNGRFRHWCEPVTPLLAHKLCARKLGAKRQACESCLQALGAEADNAHGGAAV